VVEFAAPGVDVLSLKSSGGSCTTVNVNYCRMSGTSMATPHAAGLAALVLSADPSMSPDEVQTAMQNGADDIGTPGKDIYFGYGRINSANSIVPAVPITHVDGTLIKGSSTPEIYVLEGGKKRHIPSVEVFRSWFYWDDVVTVTQTEVNTYENGSELTFYPGSLIKANTEPNVYVIDGTTRKHINSASVFLDLGYDWSDIIVVSSSEKDKYSESDKISTAGSHVNGTIIKTQNASAIYMLDGGKKRHIPNPEVYLSRYDWSQIVIISDNEMSNYAEGERLGFRPGSLAKSNVAAAVYVITDTTKRKISSAQTFLNLGYRWENIIVTTAEELNNYTNGEDI